MCLRGTSGTSGTSLSSKYAPLIQSEYFENQIIKNMGSLVIALSPTFQA